MSEKNMVENLQNLPYVLKKISCCGMSINKIKVIVEYNEIKVHISYDDNIIAFVETRTSLNIEVEELKMAEEIERLYQLGRSETITVREKVSRIASIIDYNLKSGIAFTYTTVPAEIVIDPEDYLYLIKRELEKDGYNVDILKFKEDDENEKYVTLIINGNNFKVETKPIPASPISIKLRQPD